MSADFHTEHFKGYLHEHSRQPYLHLVTMDGRQECGPAGDFTIGEITELADMAGQAWPDDDRVEVRFVIEARRPRSRWRVVWSALADEDGTGTGGVSEDYAAATFDGLRCSPMEWRLLRRTTLTVDEVIQPEPARLPGGGPGNDSTHDDGLGQDQG